MIAEPVYICRECSNRAFTTVNALHSHQSRSHNRKPYSDERKMGNVRPQDITCYTCKDQPTFQTRADFARHKRDEHRQF